MVSKLNLNFNHLLIIISIYRESKSRVTTLTIITFIKTHLRSIVANRDKFFVLLFSPYFFQSYYVLWYRCNYKYLIVHTYACRFLHLCAPHGCVAIYQRYRLTGDKYSSIGYAIRKRIDGNRNRNVKCHVSNLNKYLSRNSVFKSYLNQFCK